MVNQNMIPPTVFKAAGLFKYAWPFSEKQALKDFLECLHFSFHFPKAFHFIYGFYKL